MTATELLDHLEAHGVSFNYRGENLLVHGAISAEHWLNIAANKQIIITELSERDYAETCTMNARLQSSGYCLMHSETLGESIFLAADDAVAEKLRNRTQIPIYTNAEVDLLTGGVITDAGLRRIHRAKKLFPRSKLIGGVAEAKKREPRRAVVLSSN